MPRRNILIIFAVLAFSLICHARSVKSPYGRYLGYVFAAIGQHALEDVSQQELFDGAMEGVVAKLREHGDQYSDYVRQKDSDDFESDIRGQFGGLGVVIGLEGDPPRLTIVRPPLFGAPARDAGVQMWDHVTHIDKQPTAEMTIEEVKHAMRGPAGTEVVLTVVHDGEKEPVDITIERAVIDVPSILGDRPTADGGWEFRLESDPSIGYIRVTSFGEKTVQELTAVLDRLRREKIKALILDLRDNPGGLLDAAVETCDLFLPAGEPIVSIKRRGGILEPGGEFISSGTGEFLDWPIVVLVNHESASASEIVAACLQDSGRAVVVGERSWGKGTVQHVIRIQAGKSILKLTAASYWRPSGQNIHRTKDANDDDPWGVSPSPGMEVKLDDEATLDLRRTRSMRDIYTPPEELKAAPPAPEADPQLRRAVEYLREKLGDEQLPAAA